MKRFLIYIIEFLGILLGIILALIFLIPESKAHYIHAYPDKMAKIDTLSSPRLIIVGGSNAAFGLNTKRIADSLNINVFNTALHAGIGLRLQLDDVSRRLRQGDKIIILPEYGQFTSVLNGDDGDPALTNAVLYSKSDIFLLLNGKQWYKFISGIGQHIHGNLNSLLTADSTKELDYSAYNFDEYGDEVKHRYKPSKTFDFQIDRQTEPTRESILYLSNKVKELKNNGISVYIYPPVTIEKYFNQHKELINNISKSLDTEDIPFIVKPIDHVEPDSCAFDTPYHMNAIGVEDFTDGLIKELKEIEDLNNKGVGK